MLFGRLTTQTAIWQVLLSIQTAWTILYSTRALPLAAQQSLLCTPTVPSLNTTGEDDKKWSKNSHYYGIGLDYAHNDTVFSAMGNARQQRTLLQKSTQLFTLGGQQGF